MIFFIYGPDSYRRLKRKKEIIAAFQKKYPGAAGIFDLSEADGLEKFREFAENRSLFESVKMAVLENVFEAEAGKLIPELKAAAGRKDFYVLLSEEKKGEKTFAFLAKKSPDISPENFDYPKGAEWKKFIRAEAKKCGVDLEESAVSFLAEVYQNDTWSLATELQKISSLKKRTIKKEDLNYLETEFSPDFWQTSGNLTGYSLAGRLSALEEFFSAGEPAGKIFNVLAYRRKEKIPFFAAYDLAVKSGKMDYEEALLGLAIDG